MEWGPSCVHFALSFATSVAASQDKKAISSLFLTTVRSSIIMKTRNRTHTRLHGMVGDKSGNSKIPNRLEFSRRHITTITILHGIRSLFVHFLGGLLFVVRLTYLKKFYTCFRQLLESFDTFGWISSQTVEMQNKHEIRVVYFLKANVEL